MFGRARERGESPAGSDITTDLDVRRGPFDRQLRRGHASLTGRFARAGVDIVIAGR